MTNILTLNNFTLSLKLKEAIKFGLSFAIVYVIALHFDWMKPYWAGLSIVMVAAAAGGQNIHKGLLRAVGTIPGVIAALVIFSFASQERWLFIGMASAWMFFTTYMMLKDEQRAYLWNVAGFVCLVVLTTYPDSSATVFEYAIHRVLETTMAIVVYTLVSVFLWPQTNINTLKQISVDLLSTQVKLLKLDLSAINSDEGRDTQSQLTKQQIILLRSLKQAFYAKGSDSYEVSESMPLWEKFHYLSDVLMKITNQLHNGMTGLNVDVDKLLPNIEEYKQEIINRLTVALKLHDESKVDYVPKAIKLEINQAYLDSLNSFDKIAFAATKKELKNIEKLSREILQCTSELLDRSTKTIVDDYRERESAYYFFIIDKEKLKSAFYVSLTTFIGFVIYVYLDPPGHNQWIMLPSILSMVVVGFPQVNVSKFVPSLFFTMIYGLFIYSVVLPHLSSYIGLGILLGISFAAVTYYFLPQNWINGGTAIVFIVSVENQQVYDFAQQANTLVYMVGAHLFTFALSYMIGSSRPEKEALSMLHRYFKNAELILSALQSDEKSFIKKLKLEFYTYELNTLPSKLAAWTKSINYVNFNQNDSKEVELLISNIYFLTTSLKELIKSNRLSQTEQISKETDDEILKWSMAIKEIFKEYSLNLDKDPSLTMQESLKKHRKNAEISINTNLNDFKMSQIRNQEKEHIYEVIGSYQGVTQALISYVYVARTVKFNTWYDEYFS